MRVTKSDIISVFERLSKLMYLMDVIDPSEGALKLDYVSHYGGYVIEQVGQGGGINHPFGSMRRSAREMYYSMAMTERALCEIKYNKLKANK